MSSDCFISPNTSLNPGPYPSISRCDTVSSLCKVSPSVSPSTSPTTMPPPSKPDTVSSFCKVSPSVSPITPQPVNLLNLGKAAAVLGLVATPSSAKSDTVINESKEGVVGEEAAGKDQVITLQQLAGGGIFSQSHCID